MRTEVAITIDTEFSIGGAFDDFERWKPIGEVMVECAVDGRSHGLGFLLETFDRNATSATFFVEALNHRYFGDAPMASVCRRIAAAGRDIQLHIHPCWAAFEDGALVSDERNDSCAGRRLDELTRLFALGIEALGRWGVERPVALRTGSLLVDRTVYEAMEALDLRLGSSVGLSVAPPDDDVLRLANGRHRIGGVTEIPVTTFYDRPGHLRTMTITGCSWPEIRSVLWSARRAGLETVVILTHPFEYVKTRTFRYETLTPNRINQRRLEKLCEFIRTHDEDFVSVGFGEAAGRWCAAEPQGQRRIEGGAALAFLRMAENGLNDRVWAL
jgi:peptidoglycan/xylan/chitin deacetylase (PgdA/CDA1 family)